METRYEEGLRLETSEGKRSRDLFTMSEALRSAEVFFRARALRGLAAPKRVVLTRGRPSGGRWILADVSMTSSGILVIG